MTWFYAYFVEEIMEIYNIWKAPEKNFQEYFNIWNNLDISCIMLFFFSIIFRFSLPEHFESIRCMYTVCLLLYYLRILQFFYISKVLGPLILMILLMIGDFLKFFLILLVIWTSFGISIHALKYPNHPLGCNLFSSIFLTPYWQIYGELALEELEEDSYKRYCNDTKTYIPSRHSHPLITIFLMLYLIVMNLVLLNLLIALFTKSFDKVKEDSKFYFSYMNYDLVFEYKRKSVFPPPFNILYWMYKLFIWVKNKVKSTNFLNVS